MATPIYTGTFEQTQNTFLRLTSDPYRIIANVHKDGIAITPIAGTTSAPTSNDCVNYATGISYGVYNLGKLTTATSTVNVSMAPYSFYVVYHYYNGPSSQQTTTQTQYYGIQFNLLTTTPPTSYKFKGWAVGSQNSNVIIPEGTTQAVFTELDSVTDVPAGLKIPTLYTNPSTTLDLYALWRPCNAVTINVTVTDGSPLTTTIVVDS